VIGVSDINPFVLSLAQGGIASLPNGALAEAILIAIASNNAVVAVYAMAFGGWRRLAPAAGVLVLLAAAGVAVAFALF
jgi:hypothetical protein